MVSHTLDGFRISLSRYEVNRPMFDKNCVVEEAAIYLSPRQAAILANLLTDQLLQWKNSHKQTSISFLEALEKLDLPIKQL